MERTGHGPGSTYDEHLVDNLRHNLRDRSEGSARRRPSLRGSLGELELPFSWKLPAAMVVVFVLGVLAFQMLHHPPREMRPDRVVPRAVQEKVSQGVVVIRREAGQVVSSVTGKPARRAAARRGTARGAEQRKLAASALGSGHDIPTRAAESSGRRSDVLASYKVVRGDYLRKLAARYYGDESKWPIIWKYNRRRLGSALDNPDRIYPGWVLVIPDPKKAKDHEHRSR